MAHPLDGSRLKIVRAEEHLTVLDDEIARYLSTNPYEFVAKVDNEICVPFVRLTREPPGRVSAIIGDCLYNLRAALDYLIWQLALLTGPKDDRVRIYFPIFSEPDKFKRHWDQALSQHLPRDTFAALDRVQPYRAGYERLAEFRCLSNEDKHRVPVLAINTVVSAIIDVRSVRRQWKHMETDPAKSPAEGNDPMQVEGHATGFVAFANAAVPEPVEIVLSKILTCIGVAVLPEFEGFF
jgi:hypothetical protein